MVDESIISDTMLLDNVAYTRDYMISRQDIQKARGILLKLYKNKEISYLISDELKKVIYFLMNLETK